MQRHQRDGEAAAGKPHPLGHLGDDADCAYVPSCLGTSRTRASAPTSTDSVMGMPGNTTASSRGMILNLFIVRSG